MPLKFSTDGFFSVLQNMQAHGIQNTVLMLPYRFIIFDLDTKYDFSESFMQNVFPQCFFPINLPFRELGDLSPGLLLVGSPRIFLVVESKVKQRQAKAISGVAMSPRLFLSMLYNASLNTYKHSYSIKISVMDSNQ